MFTMFENFWNLKTNKCSLNIIYTFGKKGRFGAFSCFLEFSGRAMIALEEHEQEF